MAQDRVLLAQAAFHCTQGLFGIAGVGAPSQVQQARQGIFWLAACTSLAYPRFFSLVNCGSVDLLVISAKTSRTAWSLRALSGSTIVTT